MSTTQIMIPGPVPADLDTLQFFIECPDCNTRRGFSVTKTWEAIANREGGGMQWKIACEICHRDFSAILVWGKRYPGWTTRKQKVEGFKFVDELGLQPERGDN